MNRGHFWLMMLKQNIFKMDIKVSIQHLKVICQIKIFPEAIPKGSMYLFFPLNCLFSYLQMLRLILLWSFLACLCLNVRKDKDLLWSATYICYVAGQYGETWQELLTGGSFSTDQHQTHTFCLYYFSLKKEKNKLKTKSEVPENLSIWKALEQMLLNYRQKALIN